MDRSILIAALVAFATMLMMGNMTNAQSPATMPATAPTTKPVPLKPMRVLAFYSLHVEKAHVGFARQVIVYLAQLAKDHSFEFETTTDWSRCNDAELAKWQVVLWLDDSPQNEEQKAAFEKYMDGGGAWLGFHVAAYNDKDSHWPWFVQFLGGGVFEMNNWPPLPAKMIVDTKDHPVTRHLDERYEAPTNEWYQWKPSPRANPDVKVLVTLDPANYPIGKKDFLVGGDTPVVWTNTKYHMVYMNIGHTDLCLASPMQNRMIEDALMWLGRDEK